MSVGSLFYLQGMQVFAHHVTSGGYYISEHPAPPQELERPTVWRAPLTMLMRQHPDAALYTSNWTVGVARLGHQTDWSTQSLASSHGSIYEGCSGLGDEEAEFSHQWSWAGWTAFARAFTDQLVEDIRRGRWRRVELDHTDQCGDLLRWVEQTADAGANYSVLSSWLPDFQG